MGKEKKGWDALAVCESPHLGSARCFPYKYCSRLEGKPHPIRVQCAGSAAPWLLGVPFVHNKDKDFVFSPHKKEGLAVTLEV